LSGGKEKKGRAHSSERKVLKGDRMNSRTGKVTILRKLKECYLNATETADVRLKRGIGRGKEENSQSKRRGNHHPEEL